MTSVFCFVFFLFCFVFFGGETFVFLKNTYFRIQILNTIKISIKQKLNNRDQRRLARIKFGELLQ